MWKWILQFFNNDLTNQDVKESKNENEVVQPSTEKKVIEIKFKKKPLSKSQLQKKTKSQLVLYGKKELGIQIDKNQTKALILKQILKS
tara:strand:+ start:16 stop:279 length:264 start_codon:yes stop_codon:yes gene_type:complete